MSRAAGGPPWIAFGSPILVDLNLAETTQAFALRTCLRRPQRGSSRVPVAFRAPGAEFRGCPWPCAILDPRPCRAFAICPILDDICGGKSGPRAGKYICGRSSMVELLLPKQLTRVRFPSPAPNLTIQLLVADCTAAFLRSGSRLPGYAGDSMELALAYVGRDGQVARLIGRGG